MLIVNLYSSWHQKPSPLPSEGYQKCGSCSAGLWGAVSSWLLHWTLDRAVRVRVPAGNIVSCSWARHHAHSASLSTQVYKWVPVSLMLGLTLWWSSISSRGSRSIPSRFMLQQPGWASAWWATWLVCRLYPFTHKSHLHHHCLWRAEDINLILRYSLSPWLWRIKTIGNDRHGHLSKSQLFWLSYFMVVVLVIKSSHLRHRPRVSSF